MSRDLMPFGNDPFFSHFFGKGWLSDPFSKFLDSPQVDVEETDKEMIVKVDLPGVNPKDIQIELMDSYLTISGKSESEDEIKDKNYYHKERRYGSFQRQVPLPCAVLEDNITAKSKDGVLVITLPKKEASIGGPKKIPVES